MPVRPPIQVLVYGSPGEGKSHFLATFPKPMLVLSFDPMGKNRPYFKRGIASPIAEEGDYGQSVWTVYSKNDPERLIVSAEMWSDLPIEEAYFTFQTARLKEVAAEVNGGKWATVVLDTLSSAELSARKMHQLKLSPRAGGKEWAQGCTDSMEDLVLKLLSMGGGANVAIAAHVDKDKDEVLGRQVGTPSAPGRLQRKEGLAAKFSEVYRIHASREEDGTIKRVLQTQADQRYLATSVFLEAPDPCPADYNALWFNYDKEGGN